jgi:hypothetical protein
MGWPPTPEHLGDEKSLLPPLAYNFFTWVITDDTDEDTPINGDEHMLVSDPIHRKASSMCQDLLHNTTHGHVKTPKQEALHITVQSLTGSSEVVTILNHLGHSLSYTQVEEIETALTEKQITRQQQGTPLPTNCQRGIFSSFVWDNNGTQEETLS